MEFFQGLIVVAIIIGFFKALLNYLEGNGFTLKTYCSHCGRNHKKETS